jgi:integrase
MELFVKFPGFVIEKNRNGSPRYRVRVEGQKGRKITIPVGPDSTDFANHYYAARAGEIWEPPNVQREKESLDWLVDGYLSFLEKLVESGQRSHATLKQRRSVLRRLCDFVGDDGRYGDFHMDAPTSAFVAIRDAWAAHPGAADNLIKSVRAVYDWAGERGMVSHNPAAGITPINLNPKGGAIPWTPKDLRQFREAHPKGTTPFLWLTLLAFTACRIGDARWLGRKHEVVRGTQRYLEWQPEKKGSAPVSVPMLPQLYEATRSVSVIGPSYLLSSRGLPYKSSDSLRNQVRRWCDAAGLNELSSHGVRKGVGDMMAEAGCTQHQIMAVMAHTEARTSEKYTKGVARRVLATDGMQALARLEW